MANGAVRGAAAADSGGVVSSAIAPFYRTKKQKQVAVRNRIRSNRDLVKEFFRPLKKAFTERRVFFSAQIGKLLQLRTLLGVESGRDFHHDADKKIATLAPVDVNYAFTTELKHLTALRPRRNFQIGFPFQRRHGHLAAQRSQRKWNRHFAVEIVFIA